MHAGVVDPCTIREDMSRRMGPNGDGRELGWAWAGFIVGLTLVKENGLVFLNSRLFINTPCLRCLAVRPTNFSPSFRVFADLAEVL